MRRPVSTPFGNFDGEVLLEAVVAGGVVGDAVLPAAPHDSAPGASDGSDCAWVVVPATAGAGVSVFGPGVPFAGCVGEGRGGVSESVIAAVSEARDFLASGFDRDGRHAGVGGEVLGGGVAGAVVADLGQEGRGADHAVGVLEERQEDLAVGVRVDGVTDLGGEQADLFHDRSQRGDEREDESTAGVGFDLAGAAGWGRAELGEQLTGGLASAVVVAGEEPGEGLLAEPVRVDGAGVALEEREADRAVEIVEQTGSAWPESLQLGSELVAQRDACSTRTSRPRVRARSALV